MEEINLRELPEKIRTFETKVSGYQQTKEGIQIQISIFRNEITKKVVNNPDYKNEGQRKAEIENQLATSKEISETYIKLGEVLDRISIDGIQLNYLKNMFKVELKVDTNTQRRLEGVTEKIKELEQEETKLIYEAIDINEKKLNRTSEINKVINNKVFKDDEAKGKAAIERIIKDETIKNCVKEELKIEKKVKQVTIDKEYLKRDLIVAGISRGIKL